MKEGLKFRQFERSSGVLLNVSSLPGEFGIGCFSKDVDAFCDIIADMGFHWWQVLPITAIGKGNSPYSGLSTYAGNRLYICPVELEKEGLLTCDEVESFKYKGEPYSTDYDFAFLNSGKYLKLAFSRINDEIKCRIAQFREENKHWIEDYAMFSALALEHSTCWWKWEDGIKFRDPETMQRVREEYRDEIDFFVFEQYEFFREWNDVKKRANAKGISVIGDLPFYVSMESSDVWAHPKMFQLDENMFPKCLPGVPPDAFSADGQVWDVNCVYDFEAMREDDFSWWRNRISHCLKMYDALRLDHFRAFYNYFAIPAHDYKTARNGRWAFGPQNELLDKIKGDNPSALFIAEDLGMLDEDCRKYIDSLGITTMRVFQFGFDGTKSVHIPYNYEENNIAYTGTHDNNTTLGWLYDLNDGTRQYVLKYCGCPYAGWGAGGPDCKSTKAIIKTIAMSSASIMILPFQDLLGYGADTRMNIPSVAEGNWKYRLPYHLMAMVDRDYFLDLNKTYARMGSGVRK